MLSIAPRPMLTMDAVLLHRRNGVADGATLLTKAITTTLIRIPGDVVLSACLPHIPRTFDDGHSIRARGGLDILLVYPSRSTGAGGVVDHVTIVLVLP